MDQDDEPAPSNDSEYGPSALHPTVSLVAQIVLVTLGVAGAVAHAFFDEHFSRHLDLDLVTVAWLGVALVGLLLPSVASVEFGDVKVKLWKLRKGAADIEQTLTDAANLAQNWSTSAAIYLNMMQQQPSELLQEREAIVSNYLRDRMGEAMGFLGDVPGEKIRIVVWLYDPEEKVLRYSGIAVGGAPPTKDEYAPGEGMIGQAFVENFYERRTFNEADARVVPSYKNTREGSEPPYKAVLCIPIRWSNEPIAMLTVDKASSTYFSQIAEDIARGLASQCAIAITQYTRAISEGG
jgi:GAF domain-containing protein